MPVVETVGLEESSGSRLSADQVDFLLGYTEEKAKILFRAFLIVDANISHGLHGLQGILQQRMLPQHGPGPVQLAGQEDKWPVMSCRRPQTSCRMEMVFHVRSWSGRLDGRRGWQ